MTDESILTPAVSDLFQSLRLSIIQANDKDGEKNHLESIPKQSGSSVFLELPSENNVLMTD